jgi:hypothetical protein
MIEDFLQILTDLLEFDQDRSLAEVVDLKPAGWLVTSWLVLEGPEYVVELDVQAVEVLGVAGFVADADFEEYGEALSKSFEAGAVDAAQVLVGELLEVREFSLWDDPG